MNDQDLIDLAEKEPEVAQSIASALRRVIDFHNTRGRLLRSLTQPPQPRRTVLRLVYSKD
jgi:hypothetical protein